MLATGTRLGGLVIDALIGRGAMGEVYRATQVGLKRPVAVKRIADHLVAEPGAIARFAREAQCLARVRSPHVIGVHDFVQVRDDTGSEHCLLVMELVEGGCPLSRLVGAPLDWRLATSVVMQVADGLAAAGAAGLVHRDVKPDNIMLDRTGTARLVDFGLARAVDSTALTIAGGLMGTPAFMAPEACRGEPADQRSDLYALGCTWFLLLAGRTPFTGDNLMAMLRQHVDVPPPDLAVLMPGLPAVVCTQVARCLAKDPAQRPADARALVDALHGLGIPPTAPGLLAALPRAHDQPATAVTADDQPPGTISGQATTVPTLAVAAAGTVPTVPVAIAAGRRWLRSVIALTVIGAVTLVSVLVIAPRWRAADRPEPAAVTAAVANGRFVVAWQHLDDWAAKAPGDAVYAQGQRVLVAEIAKLLAAERFSDAARALAERRQGRQWLDPGDLERDIAMAEAAYLLRDGRHDEGERAFLALRQRYPRDLAVAVALVDAYAAAGQHGRAGYLPALVAVVEAHDAATDPLPEPTASRLLDAYFDDQPFSGSAERLRALLLLHHPGASARAHTLIDGEGDDHRLHALHLLRDAGTLRDDELVRHHLRNVVSMTSVFLAARASAAWLSEAAAKPDWPARKAAARVPAISEVHALRSRDAHATAVVRALALGFPDEMRELTVRWLAGTNTDLRANAEDLQRAIEAGKR